MRERWEMPSDVKEAIASHGLKKEYENRPPYQRNDYIGWINKAKRKETREKRINQMVEELQGGDVYMKMSWNGGSTKG